MFDYFFDDIIYEIHSKKYTSKHRNIENKIRFLEHQNEEHDAFSDKLIQTYFERKGILTL